MRYLSNNFCAIQLVLLLITACGESPSETTPAGSDTIYLGANIPGTQSAIFKKGSVSKEGIEFGMAVNPNLTEFYFTRLNSAFKGSILFSRKLDETWTIPEIASFSGNFNDTSPFITSDGQYLYFTSDRPLPNSVTTGKNHIWYVTKTSTGWSEPNALQFNVQSVSGESNPTLTANGKLYFMADYTSLGGEGLYYSTFVNGSFQPPVYCNVMKNSGGVVEVEPFIAPDESYLLFYSAGRSDNFTPNGQIGDIYISLKKNDGTWSTPKNLGGSVNSAGEESHPSVTPDGKYLFFSKNVGQGNGFVEIYWIDAGFLKNIE